MFTTTLVSDVPASVPLLVAKRMGLKIINLTPGKVTNSNILTDGNYKLIEWNSDSYNKSEIDKFYDKLQNEYSKKKNVTYPHMTKEVSEFYSPFKPNIIFSNLKRFAKFYKNKIILITGGAGSIGSEIARKLLNFKPKVIRLLDINERDCLN